MAASYATKLAEKFAMNALLIYYKEAVSENITNQDYEGEIRDKASILNVLTFGKILSHDYNGSNLVADDLTESNAQLKTDQQKAFYFKIKSLAKFQSYIKNPEGTILDQTGRELKKVIDAFVLGKYTAVAAGQRIGVDSNGGTVTVTTVTGAVTGSGTAFTAAMVGRGFKAAGHSQWYRIKSYASSTSIVIEDDLDDVASAYTGGAIGGGSTYDIEAATPVQLTKTNVYDYITQLTTMLDNAEVPEEDRWLVIPPVIHELVRKAPEYIPSGVDSAYQDVVKNGKVGSISDFTVYKTPRVNGDNVNGYHVMAGHKSGITFAMGFIENGIEDLIGNFGKAYKSLNVYGAKVADERRKALTELFCYK